MRPPHMNQCISLMSLDSPPLFLVSEDILRAFLCFFQRLKKAQFFCSRLALSFIFIHLLILSDSLSVINLFLHTYSFLCSSNVILAHPA